MSGDLVGLVHNSITLTPLKETWAIKKEIDMKYVKMAEILAT